MTRTREPTGLSAEREAEILAKAEEDGAIGWRSYEGTVDWDKLLDDYDSIEEPLPTDWDHPFVKAIKRAYRRGKKEAA